jgi:hypothetical protein
MALPTKALGAALPTLRAIHRGDRLPRFWRGLSEAYTAKRTPAEAARAAA